MKLSSIFSVAAFGVFLTFLAACGKHKNPKDVDAVFWGDSIAFGTGEAARSNGIFKGTQIYAKKGACFADKDRLSELNWHKIKNKKDRVIFIYIGTNDIMNKKIDIKSLAEKVVAEAKVMKDVGFIPVVVGINKAEGPYTGNPVWFKKGFYEGWCDRADRLNEAYEKKASAAKILYFSSDEKIGPQLISDDNLHPSIEGYRELAKLCAREFQSFAL